MKQEIVLGVIFWLSLKAIAPAQVASSTTASVRDRGRDYGVAAESKLEASPREPKTLAPLQSFVCSGGFELQQCREEMEKFRKVLAKYPVARLGNWTWVLVRADAWKGIVVPRGLDPDGPAFSYLPKRETFIEDSLLRPKPMRSLELLVKWNLSIPDLLDLAIRHELGHALCNFADEKWADNVAEQLKQQKLVTCEQPRMAKKR